MRILVQPEETSQASSIALIAGLLAAAFTAWFLVSAVQLPSGLPLIVIATIYILSIVGANALGIQAAGGISRSTIDGIMGRSSGAAAWLAPLAVYMKAGSPWAIPMAAFFAAGTVLIFQSIHAGSRPADVHPRTVGRHRAIFQLLP